MALATRAGAVAQAACYYDISYLQPTLVPPTHTRCPKSAAVTGPSCLPHRPSSVPLQFFTFSDLTLKVVEQVVSVLSDGGSNFLCGAGSSDMGLAGNAATLFLPKSSRREEGRLLPVVPLWARKVKALCRGRCDGADGCFRKTGMRLSAGACRETKDWA
jgi:hypothetical protein